MVTGRISQRQQRGWLSVEGGKGSCQDIYRIKARGRIVGNGRGGDVYEREKPGRGGVLFALFAAGTR